MIAVSDVPTVLGGLPPSVLPLAVVLVLAVESGTTIGLLVPGTTLALAAGAVTSSLPVVAGAAAVGSVLGGQVGFRVAGRARGPDPGRGPVLDRARWCAAERGPTGWTAVLLRRRPALGLLAGPWLSVGRVLVPRAAGRAGCGSGRFTLLHGPSVAAWAASTTAAGHLLGAAARSHLAAGFAVATLVVVSVGVAVWWRRPSVRHRVRVRTADGATTLCYVTSRPYGGVAATSPVHCVVSHEGSLS